MANRLASSTSPYLLQHRGNPVDWWEWGDDAFAEARQRDVPVLLSVGYAACHWCHVMAHESFEDPEVARVMNAGFVNVKVDREERPDVDATYMSATQALTGQGGWPMTVFLTPGGRPFFAGTYFPPRARQGMPAFGQVLDAVGQAWRERRDEVEAAGQQISAALGRRSLPRGGTPDRELTASAVRALAEAEDARLGGFGSQPKFPPAMALEFLLRHAATGQATSPLAEELAARTLRAMAAGGIYDQLAGGFARYSVDRTWTVPHFEKMLTDNALLALAYLHWWRLTGAADGARIALETCDWMVASLRTGEGGLASSLDADSPLTGPDGQAHAVEGLTYVWTPDQLVAVLGPDDGRWAAELLSVTPQGSFESGNSTLQLSRDVWADPEQAGRWQRLRSALAAERRERPQPGRDDKVVAAWNGLAIGALAETGALLDRPDLVAAARAVAGLLLDVHRVPAPDGNGIRLRRVSRDGVAGSPAGVLEDYGDLTAGLICLFGVTGEVRWLDAAGQLLDAVLEQFSDPAGGFFDTALDATDAALAGVRRPQDPTDNAYPSGTSAAAGALLSYAAVTGSARHREAAEAALGVVAAAGGSAPLAFGWSLSVVEALLDGPREVAVVGPGGRAGEGEGLHRVALAGTAPGMVIAVGEPDQPGVPLLAERPLVGGRPAAYVCQGFVCRVPTASAVELATAIGARPEVG